MIKKAHHWHLEWEIIKFTGNLEKAIRALKNL